MKSTLFFLLVFFPLFSFASSEAFPTKEIFVQVFNFSLFFIALVFLLRKPVKVFFHKRQEEFFSFERQALALEKNKQKELQFWEEKLKALEEQEKGIQEKAKKRGEDFIQQKKGELKALKERLKKEAEFFLRLEKEKAKRELLRKWKDKIALSAEAELKESALSSDFHQERYKSFLKQVGARSLQRSER